MAASASLCPSCQGFDIQAFARPGSPWMTTKTALVREGSKQGCNFCKFLTEGNDKHFFRENSLLKRGFEWLHWTSASPVDIPSNSRLTVLSDGGLGIAILLVKLSKDPKPCLFSRADGYNVLNLHADEGSPAATSGDIIGLPPVDRDPSSRASCNRIRKWLDYCESHQECANTLSMARKVERGRSPLPTRCIRVSRSTTLSNGFNYKLEETGGKLGEYVSLSHRWSNPETPRSSTYLRNYHDRLAGLQSAFQDIDPLFTDVLLVASQVGISYVWIDSLCIIQDSPQDWNAEAVKMADYYQNASFTIMAAVPPSKRSEGLFHIPEGDLYRLARLPYRDKEGNRKGHFYVSCHIDPARETQQHNQIWKNNLLSRGWVFQEWALSRRIAWYTEHGLTLRCKCRNLQHQGESLINLDPSPGLHRILPLLGMVIPKHRWDRYKAVAPLFRSPLDWQSLVSQYSTMQLTKPEEDRLVALSGVAQEFITQESSAKLVCGLRPWCLGVDLLWKQDAAGIHPRYTEFPSWSWASINASVSWIQPDDAIDCFNLLGVSSTPGGRVGPTTNTGGISTSPTGIPSSTANQGILTAAFAPGASMNTLNIRCRLMLVVFGPILEERSRDLVYRASRYAKEEPPSNNQPRAVALANQRDTIAGWASLEEPDLQLDDAFASNPIIFALCVSVLRVARGSGLFRKGSKKTQDLSKLKKKLRSSDSTDQQSSQPASVPSASSTSQITTPSCHQSTAPCLAFPVTSSSVDISESSAITQPETITITSPSAEAETASPNIPERLWNQAYNILKEKEPEIVKSYQEILKLVQHEWDDTTAPEELQSLEHCKSPKSRQMWRLVYSGLEKSKRQAKRKESVSNIIETIDNLKGVVDKAVKYSSEAAIAWAGVSLGVEDNSSVPSAALRTNLETHIIEFYEKLLLFQMRSACLYYRNWVGVILRDADKLDDWAGEVNTIKDAERLIREDIEQYDNQDIRLKLGTIEESAVDQAESLESICKILCEETRLEEKNAQDDKDKECLSYEWILKSDAYQTFIDDPSSRVLWINGPPGKGKTMLLCGIIDELEKSLRPISFFLCQANVKKEDLSSDIAVMRGLIYLLLEHQPSLMSAIRPSYEKQKDGLFNSINSSELLGHILTKMLQDACLKDTTLLVDALDECNINRTKLTSLIVRLSKSCNTKWIVSSRDWPEIYQELADTAGLIALDLEQEHESVSLVVKSYISQKVDDLARTKWKNDLELKENIFNYMQSRANGTFLWVALVCERLANSGIRKRLVMEELVKFPTSLGALYQAMLDRITNSSEADRLKQILALVCVVYRPIRSAEIPTLVEPMAGYDEDDVEDTIASCGSFLTLQDGEVFFVHQSAKECLLDQGHKILFPHGENYQHRHIFLRSIEAMENTLRQDIYELGSPGALNPVEVPSPDPLASIKYSCVYWAQHFCKSDFSKDCGLPNLEKLFHFLQIKFTCWLEALGQPWEWYISAATL
ncbi:heterokaryon incompatibility protein het-E-1 [Fusarium phyllophilum]|uniref:Heterokaryon incompatibility protein het-E-1 n=1 Tax=Fusarium phyllophilum TaxID=47803 RepID=A0A8H5JXA4_9HYPO|nr:heterokaryon incompatibility protein het-E-1 [Fusarium phyllophilum]